MAVGATGTPSTNFAIPKYSTSGDAPNGTGFNSAVDFLDSLLMQAPMSSKIVGLTDGDIPIWDSATSRWIRPTGTPDGSKFLRDDGTWAAAGGSSPAGAITAYGAASAPTGWLLCDGTAASRTTYAALFAVISTTYGVGDGSTTFNLPDLQGRIPVGLGSHADVNALADNDGSALADRRPKHKHTVNDPTHEHTMPGAGGGGGDGMAGTSGGVSTAMNLAATGITVGPQTNSPTDGPAYLVVNYIIKT